MSESARIADQLRRSYQGKAWHGPALKQVLDGIDSKLAAGRISGELHTIEEIVAHVAAWAAVAHRTLADDPYRSLSGAEDWPEPGESWPVLLKHLEREQQALWEQAARLSDDHLGDIVSAEKNYSVYVLLHGVVQHNIYHAGQISLLRKLAAS